jgi:hypothetical protein
MGGGGHRLTVFDHRAPWMDPKFAAGRKVIRWLSQILIAVFYSVAWLENRERGKSSSTDSWA